MFGAGYLLEMLRNSGTNQPDSKKKKSMSPKKLEPPRQIDNSQATASNESAVNQESSTTKPEASSLIVQAEVSSISPVEVASPADQPRGTETTEETSPMESSEVSITKGEETEGKVETGPSFQPRICLNFTTPARLLLKESTAFAPASTRARFANNFLKGCKWSPDGSCLLTNSEDRKLRVFTLPAAFYESKFFDLASTDDQSSGDRSDSLSLLSSVAAGELVYDYCWYPLMNSASLESCVYVQTSCDHPIQLCDAVSGQLCATYLPINHLDEVTYAYSLAFNPDGSRLYAGFNKTIRVFDTYRPGRQISSIPTWRKRQGGQSGIISCIAVCPTMPSLYACGSYARTVATYSDSFDEGPLSTMQAENMGGVTHLAYHPDGNHLFSGGRMDPKIICWDLRVPGRIVSAYERDAATNQRFYFDLDPSGKYLVSGGSRGEVKVWDTTMSPQDDGHVEPVSTFRAHHSAVNGVSINLYLPILATSSGQRLFSSPWQSSAGGEKGDSSDTENDEVHSPADESYLDNSIKLWYVGADISDVKD